MGIPVTVPRIGNDDAAGRLAEWYVQEGDTVAAGDLLFRLERDNAAVDIEAEADGVLRLAGFEHAQPMAGTVVASLEAPAEAVMATAEPIPFRHTEPADEASALTDEWFEWHDDEPATAESEPPALAASPAPAEEPFASDKLDAGAHQPEEASGNPDLDDAVSPAAAEPEELVESPLADSRWQMLMDVAASPVAEELGDQDLSWDRGMDWDAPEAREDAVVDDDEADGYAMRDTRADEPLAFEWPAAPEDAGGDDLDPAAWVFEEAPAPAPAVPAGLLDVIATHDGGDWLAPSDSPITVPADPVTTHHTPERIGRLPVAAMLHDVDHRPIASRTHTATATGAGLSLSIDVEVHELCEQLAATDQRESEGQAPRPEYAVVAAVARALADHESFRRMSGDVGLCLPDETHERLYRFTDARSATVAELVAASHEQDASGAEVLPDCLVSSFAAFGVREATARLQDGHTLAFAMGAIRDEVAFEGRALVAAMRMTVALTYDPRAVTDGAAASLLGRVAHYLHQPAELIAPGRFQ